MAEAAYNAQSSVPATSTEKVSDGNEEILQASVTNGNSTGDGGVTGIEYLEEEHDALEGLNNDTDRNHVEAGDEDENIEEVEEVEEELDEEVEEQIEEGDEETPKERKPTQVPKKRRDAALLASSVEEGDEGEEDDEEEEGEGEGEEEDDEEGDGEGEGEGEDENSQEPNEEKPTSSARAAAANKENTVDEEQCRVCTTKEDLVSLFKIVERQTVADMLMTICPNVSIARKDFMPQFICNPCLDNVTIAVQLKVQCESTERELRKKLSRHKNKVRRPTGYVVIDAPAESDPPTDEEPNNDDEFKVSDVEVSASAEDDSDDSDFSSKKKKKIRGTGGKRGRRKSCVVTPTPKIKEKKRPGRPPLHKRPPVENSSDEDSMMERASNKKRKMERDYPEKTLEFPCDQCEQVFTRKLSLVLHKKGHAGGRELINCEVCGKQFKIMGAYRTHLERHKDEPTITHNCDKCDDVFPTKADLRRHMSDEHGETGMILICGKCKRTFVSEARLARHQDGRCPGQQMIVKQKPKKSSMEGFSTGKDLFKSVAPLTTTYWSDSFSD